MTEKEKIFGRIREALRTKAPPPGLQHGSMSQALNSGFPPEQTRQWLPRVGVTLDEQIALFRKMALELKAEVVLAKGREELEKSLQALKAAEHWKKIAIHTGELTGRAAAALELPQCRTDQPYDVNDLESCDAGISECDALIAQTGSVLVTSLSAGGRALSVLPPHHVVLARTDQIVPDLPAAFAFLKTKYGSNYPSFISVITGPSRTGDIERILVLGAHGPKKLTIVLIQEGDALTN